MFIKYQTVIKILPTGGGGGGGGLCEGREDGRVGNMYVQVHTNKRNHVTVK